MTMRPDGTFNPHKNRLYESMTKMVVSIFAEPLYVRVWRSEERLRFGPDHSVQECVAEVSDRYHGCARHDEYACRGFCEALMEELSNLPGVEAVEVVDSRGDGALIYPDWK